MAFQLRPFLQWLLLHFAVMFVVNFYNTKLLIKFVYCRGRIRQFNGLFPTAGKRQFYAAS